MVALITEAVNSVCLYIYGLYIVNQMYTIILHVVVPVTVLIINAIVVREVRRRASSGTATNLGLQRHQSTSSNSAVPTVMLVTTSLVYVLLHGTWSIFYVIYQTLETDSRGSFYLYNLIVEVLTSFVFAYNFYVYLITGKQFRSELHKLFCCRCRSCSCSSFSLSPDVAAASVVTAARHG